MSDSTKKSQKTPAPVAVSPAPVEASAPVAVSPAPVEASAPVAVSPAPVEASAPVAVSPAPVEASAPVAADPLVDLDKRIADLKVEIAKAISTDDFVAQASLAANAALLRSQRIDIALGKSIEEFIPKMLESIEGAPEGKYLVLVTFDGGKAVAAVRRAMVETAAKATLTSIETKGREAVRSNFLASGSSDPRSAPAGAWREITVNGDLAPIKGTWKVVSLGGGKYRAVNGDLVIEGTGNEVSKRLAGTPVNHYKVWGLDASPFDLQVNKHWKQL